MDIETYRKDAEAFLQKIEKEYYLHFAGLKPGLELKNIYSEHQELFTTQNLGEIKDLEAAAGKKEAKKRLTYLLKFCVEGYIERKVKEQVEDIAQTEASLSVEIEGQETPFRFSEILLANEKEKQKRDLIDDKRNQKLEKVLNPKLLSFWQDLHSIAGELGFGSYKALFSHLKKTDIDKLAVDMERLLEDTQGLYLASFPSLLKQELGLDIQDSRRSDFAYFKRATRYDVFFKKENLISIFKDTLRGMGIDIDRQQNIIFDIEERKSKSPRAFCSTVKVPEEIYLVIMPSGGQDDYEALLHEGGHAEHFANARRGMDFEYRYLGDNSVTEGYAFVFENLMHNRMWLEKYFGMGPEAAEDFLYFSNIVKLWYLRRYAAKLKYEMILHDGGAISGKESEYSALLNGALGMDFPSSSYLKDVDEGFYCTNYIRAWIFESQLKEYMFEEYGYGWFDSKKAGDFLKEIFSYGQRFDAEEVLDQIGYKGLDISYLIESLEKNIKV